LKLQGGGDRKAKAEVDHIAKLKNVTRLKVTRILENLQRACRWVEEAASQRSTDPLPELEALGEQLCGRYRSLAYVMLLRFDLWGKATQPLQTEHIEDIAAILLASGGVFSDSRERCVEVLSCAPSGTGLDASVRENLKQLQTKVIQPKFNDLKTLILQEIERHAEPAPSVAQSRRNFFRGWTGQTTKSKVPDFLAALVNGMSSLGNPRQFKSFFGTLADFAEKLRQLNPSDLEYLFQSFYTAVEIWGDRELASTIRASWPDWLHAWLVFLEMYRVCAVCVLFSTVNTMPGPDNVIHQRSEIIAAPTGTGDDAISPGGVRCHQPETIVTVHGFQSESHSPRNTSWGGQYSL